MTVKELYSILDRLIPTSLSCEWDNDGAMCLSSPSREVKKVLVTLDVTKEAADKAINEGYDLIISHHPLIFKGLKTLSPDDHIAAKAISLISSGVSVLSFHTRLDAVKGGVNDTLAELIGLRNVTAFGLDGDEIGRIGTLPSPLSPEALAEKIKHLLSADGVLVASAGKDASRVALLGGNGKDDLRAAIAAGADTYISGRIGYHEMTDARELGINLIEAGHFYTEFPVCETFAKILADVVPEAEVTVFNSNRIKLV